MPVSWLRGSISGKLQLTYDGGDAYELPTGTRTQAEGYAPRVIAMYGLKMRKRVFQVRTRCTVNATEDYRKALALMGGTAAIFAAITRDATLLADLKSAHKDNAAKDETLRAYAFRIIRMALAAKSANIVFGDVTVNNPWKSVGVITLSDNIINKFNSFLS